MKLKAVPHSVSFCSSRGDLLVGIDNHLYKIPHYACKSDITLFKTILFYQDFLLKIYISEKKTLILAKRKSMNAIYCHEKWIQTVIYFMVKNKSGHII